MSGSERLNRKAISKNANLDALERRARKDIPVDRWDTREAFNGMKDWAMRMWNLSDGAARNYAQIVQLRLTAPLAQRVVSTGSDEVDPLTPEQEEEMSVSEIISAYRKAQPISSLTDFPVQEEGEDE